MFCLYYKCVDNKTLGDISLQFLYCFAIIKQGLEWDGKDRCIYMGFQTNFFCDVTSPVLILHLYLETVDEMMHWPQNHPLSFFCSFDLVVLLLQLSFES